MSEEGLWTVQFSKSEAETGGVRVEEQLHRGGIFVLYNHRLLGGGLSYYFVGTYKVAGSELEITVNATKYNDIVGGIFGPLEEGRVIFKGKIDGDSMTLHGSVEDDPKNKLVINAVRRTGIT
jgi:hypothetical protein